MRGTLGGPNVEAKLHQACGEQRQLTLVGVSFTEMNTVAACRQATVISGQLALGERMRKSRSKPMTAGGTHLRSKQHVDGLAERRAETLLERKHGFLNGNPLTAANITTIAVRQQQVVVTLLLNGFASHDAGRCLASAHAGRLGSERYGTEARGFASMTYSVLAMKAYCTLIRPCTPQPLAMA